MPRPKHELIREMDKAGDILDRVGMELGFSHRDRECRIVALDIEDLALKIRLARRRLKRSVFNRERVTR